MSKPTFLSDKKESECGCGNCKQAVEILPQMEKEPATIKYILFGDRAHNKPMSCYHVGLLGCVKIEEVNHGVDGANIPVFSYIATMKDGHMSDHIDNAFYVFAE